jgi:hypothetical protein
MIIGLLGQAQAGKDSVGTYLCDKHHFYGISFARKLKDICEDLFDLTDDQLDTMKGKTTVDSRYNTTPRRILQKVGVGMREIYDNVWVDALFNPLFLNNMAKSIIKNVVVTDVRFLNEVKAIKKLSNGVIIRLIREDFQALKGKEAEHSSETEQLTIPDELIDLTLSAKTGELQKLYDGIDQFLKHFSKKL